MSHTNLGRLAVMVCVGLGVDRAAFAAGTACGSLTELKIPGIAISSATPVAAGQFQPPSQG
jgi:hypothetical protein